jgi:serine/threonine kinase PknH
MQQLLPPGYSPQSCVPAPASADALAILTCGRNSDPGGPASTVFTIVGNDAAMQAVFAQGTSAIANVNCPGNIRSPGPWRRKAASERINGILLCGYRGGVPAIAWTANDELIVSVVQADVQETTLDGLYAWWLTHS